MSGKITKYKMPEGLKAWMGMSIAGGTPGSVLFIGSAGSLAEDNANFFWNDSLNRLGINAIAAPSLSLDVRGSVNTSFTNNPLLAQFMSNDALAAGMGAGLSLGGVYSTGGNIRTTFAYIAGVKENAVDGETGGKMLLGVRVDGAGAAEMTKVWILPSGYVGIGTGSPDGGLHVLDRGANGSEIRIEETTNTKRPTMILENDSATAGFYHYGTAAAGYPGDLRLYMSDNTKDFHITNTRSVMVNTGDVAASGIFQVASGTSSFIINASGYVGVGTKAPATKFHVVDGNGYARTSNDGGWVVKRDVNDDQSVVLIRNSADTDLFEIQGDGNVGIGTTSPTAYLQIKGGTATNPPIKFTAGTALTTAECGSLEFHDGRLYMTNVADQRALDRTSDVAVSTVTVANTVTETTMWTGSMAANSLVAGNVFKFHADGVVSNNGPAAADEVTVRIKVGGVTKVTLNPNTKTLTNVMWHIDANATQRTLGAAGSRAIHVHLIIGDPISTGDEVNLEGVAAIDTTANMDVTVTAQWASAKAANTISLYQGFMEYKN